MKKLYFYPASKMNARIAETIIPGEHIVIDDITFEQLTRRPNGKILRRKLVNEAKQERIVIYG